MKIKALFGSIITILALGFVACDDDMNSVGGNMKPVNDSIYIGIDTVTLTAKTISLKDSIYARSGIGLLGNYVDEIYGEIVSDYLFQLHSPGNKVFAKRSFAIDSVKMNLMTSDFTGNDAQRMGITAYEVTTPLEENYYTNIDPSKYSDLTKPLIMGSFYYKDAIAISTTAGREREKKIVIPTDTLLARRFLNEWLDPNSKVYDNTENFNRFFPGMYLTTTYGTGNLISVYATTLDIYYKYKDLNKGKTMDSIYTSVTTIMVSPEVIQLNRIKNDRPSGIDMNDPAKSYLMSPAGLCTELTIPLNDIAQKSSQGSRINSASFHLKGFTEEETTKLRKPAYLLFINKDSVENFFEKHRLPDNKTSFLMGYDTDANVYFFLSKNVNAAFNNVAEMITYYLKEYKDEAVKPDLKYLVMPVHPTKMEDNNKVATTTNLYHLMAPTSAILRTDAKNLRMALIFSKHIN